MIVGFRHTETEKVWNGLRSRKLPTAMQAGALRKLRLINAARRIDDLRVPPTILSKRCEAIVPDNGAFASTTSGASASAGTKEARTMSRSSITTAEHLPNPHPGEILLKEFLRPMTLLQTALARAIGVPPRRINEIVLGKRAITADTDLRLARYFGLSDGFFLQLQSDHDLMARRRQIGEKLRTIRPRSKAA